MPVERLSLKAHHLAMMKPVLLTALFLTASLPAIAAQTDWVENEGGAMRLVTTGDGINFARGVLEIKLNAGWKTYWREPGDGGIPPSLNGDGMAVEFLFPAPERISENDQVFSGYHGSVSLPFLLPETLVPVEKVTAFIGVCSEVCVPFQAEFPLKIDAKDADIVEAAFAKLPKRAELYEGVVSQKRDGTNLVLEVAGLKSELFLAPERGLYFGVPEATSTGFTVKVIKEKTPNLKVNYTLKTSDGAIDGSFLMPD